MRSPRLLRPLAGPAAAMLLIAATAGYLVTRPPDLAAARGSSPRLAPAAATWTVTGPGARALTSASSVAPSSGTVPAATASRLYRFLLLQPDHVTPIRWNPCRPLHYRIALDGLVPESESADIRAAFAQASAALGGVDFVFDGWTTVVPRTVDDSARAGVDLVFAFATPGSGPHSSPLLTGWEAGRGGFAASGIADSRGVVVEHPTHGSIVIDAPLWRRMSRHDRTVLYLHEIGHAVGLDHPADSHQIMTPGAYSLPARYQPGDLAGLALLGRHAGCTS